MIIALDVSTAKVGVAILSNDGKDLLLNEVIIMNPKHTLIEKAEVFADRMYQLETLYNEQGVYRFDTDQYEYIDRIVIEEPLMMVAAGSGMAYTTSLLQRFNGMCSYIAFLAFHKEPELINVNRARSTIGIKFVKGMEKKAKKGMVIEHVAKIFPKDFVIEKTKFDNYKPGLDDKADAIVLALYGATIK